MGVNTGLNKLHALGTDAFLLVLILQKLILLKTGYQVQITNNIE